VGGEHFAGVRGSRLGLEEARALRVLGGLGWGLKAARALRVLSDSSP